MITKIQGLSVTFTPESFADAQKLFQLQSGTNTSVIQVSEAKKGKYIGRKKGIKETKRRHLDQNVYRCNGCSIVFKGIGNMKRHQTCSKVSACRSMGQTVLNRLNPARKLVVTEATDNAQGWGERNLQ